MTRKELLTAIVGATAVGVAFSQTPNATNPDPCPGHNQPLSKMFARQSFNRQWITIDTARFHRCKFHQCTLVYGGGPLDLQENVFDDCELLVVGAARRTYALLQEFSNSIRIRTELKKEEV